MQPGVSFDSVTKKFGETHAVRELSLQADEGEFLVLVGPSGCGKTTALRMVAGLEEPTSGEISIAGTMVNNVAPKDRDIAMVFQSYALYPHMSVFDNLAFGLRQRRTPKDEIKKRVADAAEMLGLQALMERRPRELSGGQRQRVALGRAIVRRPKVFLMDEPLSNLDAHLRLRTRGEIVALHRRLQTTVMYVTHDQVEAMTMGTRIAVMKDGVLQQFDTPQRLYDVPVNSFVATFIGSPAMNIVEGDLAAVGEAVVFTNGYATMALSPRVYTGADGAGAGRVMLGIRPEHLQLAQGETGPGALSGEVMIVEPLGSDLFVTIDCAGSAVVARLAPDAGVAVGERIQLRPNAASTHLFDAETGLRLG